MSQGVVVATEDDDDKGWDLPLPPADGATVTDAGMTPSPPTDNGDNYTMTRAAEDVMRGWGG